MRTRTVKRAVIALSLLASAVFGISAKCIEHDSLQKGPDGNWHIYGEIHNETDVQGLDIALSGTVFGGSDQQIGVGQALMCPSALSPGTFSVYDIGVVIPPTAPRPDSHKVNVMGGKASGERLPALQGTFADQKAELFIERKGAGPLRLAYSATFVLAGSEPRGVLVGGGAAYRFQSCVAMYAADGDVVGLVPPVQTEELADPLLTSNTTGLPTPVVSDTRLVSTDAVEIRFLLWRVTPEGAPASAVAISPPVSIVGLGHPKWVYPQ